MKVAPGQNFATPLYDAIGEDAFTVVGEWLREIASDGAVEWDGKVCSPSVAWLAEVVTFYARDTPKNEDE